MHLSDALRFSFLLSCCAAGALQAKALDTYLRKKYQKQGIYHTPELQSKKFKTVLVIQVRCLPITQRAAACVPANP